MSFEQDIINLADAAYKTEVSGLNCTDSQFENGERLIQQKGLGDIVRFKILFLKSERAKAKIKQLEDENREHEQRRDGHTTIG